MEIIQTFLPYPNFSACAKVLDRQRLGKQRVEAFQILQTLFGIRSGWSGHPAVEMWRGHELALGIYGVTMCQEWIKRGYEDTMWPRIRALVSEHCPLEGNRYPLWLGYPRVHASHRLALYGKYPAHYGSFNRALLDEMARPCCEGCNYYWPTHDDSWVAVMRRAA